MLRTRDELAHVQAAHEPLRGPFRGVHGTHGAVEVDRDGERGDRVGNRDVFAAEHADGSGDGRHDEQHEEQ